MTELTQRLPISPKTQHTLRVLKNRMEAQQKRRLTWDDLLNQLAKLARQARTERV